MTSRLQHILFFSMILLLGEMGYVATDTYLPALPTITKSLHASPILLQMSILFYLIGFGMSQLIYGPLSNIHGRRKTVLIGLIITILSSLLCVVVFSAKLLIVARLFQGIGTGATTVIARAIMSDVYSGVLLARAGSYYAIVASQLLAAMPIIGSYIQRYLGWRGDFGFILLYAFITFLLVWRFLPETCQQRENNTLQPAVILKNYFSLLTDKIFLGYLACSSFALAGLITYAALSPFLFETVLGFTPVQYAWLTIINCAAFVLGGLINSQLIMTIGVRRMLIVGIAFMCASGSFLFITGIAHIFEARLLIIASFIFSLGACWIFSNAAAEAMTPYSHIAGTAGALFGSLQLVIAALVSMGAALLHRPNQIPLALIFAGMGYAAALVYLLCLKQGNDTAKVEACI